MAKLLFVDVEVLEFEYFEDWCPMCLLVQPWIRMFLRVQNDGQVYKACATCGFGDDEFGDDE